MATDYYLRVFISAEEWNQIPLTEFEWIDESHAAKNRSYIAGVIHYSKLKNTEWWKRNDVSLILDEKPFIESNEIEALRPERSIQFLEQAI